MEFEFDPKKSRTNKEKHGIDFTEAQTLWLDEDRLEVEARETDELRCVVFGVIDGKHWSAIITYRGDRVRIISVRRSRPKEVDFYESGRS